MLPLDSFTASGRRKATKFQHKLVWLIFHGVTGATYVQFCEYRLFSPSLTVCWNLRESQHFADVPSVQNVYRPGTHEVRETNDPHAGKHCLPSTKRRPAVQNATCCSRVSHLSRQVDSPTGSVGVHWLVPGLGNLSKQVPVSTFTGKLARSTRRTRDFSRKIAFTLSTVIPWRELLRNERFFPCKGVWLPQGTNCNQLAQNGVLAKIQGTKSFDNPCGQARIIYGFVSKTGNLPKMGGFLLDSL